ncbi:MAG: MATE family efflux transporter [Rhizomicrobium sp.]
MGKAAGGLCAGPADRVHHAVRGAAVLLLELHHGPSRQGTLLAAHIVSLNIPSVTFMVPLGVAMAATVRVGLAAGANDAEAVRRAG